MHCDFIVDPSIETIGSVDDAKQVKEDGPIAKINKIKQIEAEFVQQQRDVNISYMNDYKKEQIRLENELELKRNSKSQISQKATLRKLNNDSASMVKESEGNEDDDVIIEAGSSPDRLRQNSRVSSTLSPPPVMDVVTNLNAEDFTGMTHLKARKLAQFIIKSKEQNRSQIGLKNGHNSKGFSTAYGRQSFGASPNVALSRQQSKQEACNATSMQDNMSVNPNHTSYNLWPRGA